MNLNPKNFKGLDRFKYVGYCISQMPPGEDPKIEDLVEFAKFQLCQVRNILWKDPIWDAYSPEEVLIEYYAYLCDKNPEFRKKLEEELKLVTDEKLLERETMEWMEEQVRKNVVEAEPDQDDASEEVKSKEDDEFEFVPTTPGTEG